MRLHFRGTVKTKTTSKTTCTCGSDDGKPSERTEEEHFEGEYDGALSLHEQTDAPAPPAADTKAAG
jgi:hypothetical protein